MLVLACASGGQGDSPSFGGLATVEVVKSSSLIRRWAFLCVVACTNLLKAVTHTSERLDAIVPDLFSKVTNINIHDV
jgi:hypothetical protein